MTRADWIPSVDIAEAKDEFLIKMDIPEVGKNVENKDIEAHQKDGMLHLHLIKATQPEPKYRKIQID